jgi:cytochrome c biogenesis protein CcdA/thiol-disulfide isomerase/thioredoxin
MALLVVFALLAGAVTAVTPCVLPVLPALLSASGAGGRRRPVGVVVGLTLTFFVTIVGLATVVDGVGLGDGTTRSFAIVVLAGFGLALLVPALGHRVEAPLARLSRLGPRSRGDGLLSGVAVGGALGFVYAPCAGPILAGVISVSAAQGASAEVVIVAAAYALGSGVTLLALAFGGRRLLGRLSGARSAMLQRGLGAIMVATAIAMAADLDVRFQTALANDFPSFIANPTRALERSDAVERRLRDLRGESRFDARESSSRLPRLGAAPELVGTQRWFNSQPLKLTGLRGKVVLVDFWTYTCINCIRTLPYLKQLDERYRDAGLVIVGVHTPEFSFEKNATNVADAIRQNNLRYPVVQDNDYATWNAFGNQFWPAKYLIDAQGQVRYTHFGEGAYDETEDAVRTLLREAGARPTGSAGAIEVERAAAGHLTPETYLGAQRAERFLPGLPRPGRHLYTPVRASQLLLSHFTLEGTWDVDQESATAGRDARIAGLIRARKVFLVLSSRGRVARRVGVRVDGRPSGARTAGEDVRRGAVTVTRQRLYRLVSLAAVREFRLQLDVPAGVTAYAFTFG